MKRPALVSVVALSVLVGGVSLRVHSHPRPEVSPAGAASSAQAEGADLSAKPAAGDPSAEARFAWYLFIQAMTPSSGANGPLTFENWVEQCQLNPGMIGCPAGAAAKAQGRVLHASALHPQLVEVLRTMSADVLIESALQVTGARRAFAPDGGLVDEALARTLTASLARLQERVRQDRAARAR